MSYRSGQVITHVRIPTVAKVNVDMFAGDLNIHNVRACLTVDMGAGDVDLEIPEDLVASITLDAGVGDASLTVDDHYHGAPRSCHPPLPLAACTPRRPASTSRWPAFPVRWRCLAYSWHT